MSIRMRLRLPAIFALCAGVAATTAHDATGLIDFDFVRVAHRAARQPAPVPARCPCGARARSAGRHLGDVLAGRRVARDRHHPDLRVRDERIAALLAGERLVPPAPLPPDVFTTREVEAARPLGARIPGRRCSAVLRQPEPHPEEK